MDERRGPVQRLFLERGSYTIEGIVAIGVFFILVMLIVQIGFLILARSAAGTTIEAALRRAAVTDVHLDIIREGLVRDLYAVVPGVQGLSVDVTGDGVVTHAVVQFRWLPPGPDLLPVTVSVERSVLRVVPP